MEECTYAPHVAHSCTCQDSDNLLFQIAAKRVIDEIDRFPVSFLGAWPVSPRIWMDYNNLSGT